MAFTSMIMNIKILYIVIQENKREKKITERIVSIICSFILCGCVRAFSTYKMGTPDPFFAPS